MHPHTPSRALLVVCALLVAAPVRQSCQGQEDFANSFHAGREYFILRSGNAKLILQADRSGMQPAFTYMLFDANKPCQTLRKERAFNCVRGKGCGESALEVLVGGVPFTPLGHTTDVQWQCRDGLPSVEARWWAGGIEVRESFAALEGSNCFIRKIVLRGKDIAGPDSVRLRLSLPPGRFVAQQSMLVTIVQNAAIAVGFTGQADARVDRQRGFVESTPIRVTPGGEIEVSTLLLARIPAGGYSYDQECGDDRPLQARFLRAEKDSSAAIGLKGLYFNNPDLRGIPVVVRRDTNMSPYWDAGSPAEGIRADSFSVRWTGSFLPPRSGLYRFSVVADDKARLFIGDSLLIDCWENSWNVTRTAETRLDSGKLYDMRIEFAELAGWAGVRLRCTVPVPPPDEQAVRAGLQEISETFTRMSGPRTSEEAAATRDRWNQASTIETPDSLIRRLFDNSRFALPGMVAPNGTMDAGIFEYGTQWVRDGSNVSLGLIHAGHFESARALLRFILTDLVSAEGTTVVSGGFDDPDREEFDQMGELVHALKSYRDWTGDSSLFTEHRTKIIAMIERPLQPRFRDSTGMVHNRREYWERTFGDAYELAYQTFMVRGLRDAADLSRQLGVPERGGYWKSQADVFLGAMLSHPSRSLVDQGALTKRRSVDGSIANFIPAAPPEFRKDDPVSSEAYHRLNPDASSALPICLRVVDPRSALARTTLDRLEEIWNARWQFGGYERYHSSSQQDQPGPWSFATAFIARAQHDAGLYDRSRRSLEWLLRVQGGNAGAWYEEIPLIRSQIPTSGIVPWTSAETVLFTVRHWLGISFEGAALVIRPELFPGTGRCRADLRFRSSRLRVEIDKAGAVSYAMVNGRKTLPRGDGSILVPEGLLTGNVDVRVRSR